MVGTQLYIICLCYGLVNLASICLIMILANLHDIVQIRKGNVSKQKNLTPDSAPHVNFSIIIPAHNEEKVIERCLRSITQLDYHAYEVIIMDDGSRDGTDRLIRATLQAFEKDQSVKAKQIRFLYVGSSQNRGKARALDEGITYANGEVVVCMDADATFRSDALSRAAVYFADPRVVILAANNKLAGTKTWLGLLQRVDFIGNYRSKKAYDILNAEYIVSGIGAMYRKSVIDKIGGIPNDTMTEDIDTSLLVSLMGNRHFRIRYAEDVVTYMEPVHTFRDLLKQRYRWKFGNMQAMFKSRKALFSRDNKLSNGLRFWRFPLAIWAEISMLVELAFMAFMIMITLRGNGMFLLASYIIATSLCAATILADDSEPWQEKLKLLPFIGVMYLLSLVMNVVQLYASLKSLATIHELWAPKQGYAWKSPVRHGTTLHS